MRTKTTTYSGSRARKTVATSNAPKEDVRSPTQPQELSEQDRQALKTYLTQEKPFTVIPLSRKRKRSGGNVQLQGDLFEDRLAVQYEVKPSNNWEAMRRYKKFTVGDESIATGECILVKHDEQEDEKVNLAAQWKAKVLEVRALDSEHVYIRVSWLNRPEDLPDGRKSYHGKNELIPSNQMDIIDAMAVNGRLDVMHWDNDDGDSPMPAEDQYFWRQTFDFANTKTFSELPSLCIDDMPQNPDELILQCSSSSCREWQHVKCIAENAVAKATKRSADKGSSADPTSKTKKKIKSSPPKQLSIQQGSTAQAKAQKNAVIAEVRLKGLPAANPADTTEILIWEADGEQRSEPLQCLFCNAQIVD